MSKSKETKPEEKLALTEWQKRNVEFLKKKQAQAEEEKKLKEKLLSEKKAQMQENSDKKETEEVTESEGHSEVSSEESSDNPKKATKKEKAPKKIKKPKEPRQKGLKEIAFLKAWPVLVIAFVLMSLSLFMITPFSKQKVFSVTGNKETSLQLLVEESGVKASDYWLSILFNPKPYERAIVAKNPWVKKVKLSYQFPNRFQFKVTEFNVIAYAQAGQDFQPILENGRRVEVVSQSDLPKSFLIINLEKEKAIQSLITSLTKLPKKLVKNIKSISLANSETTKDLLLIEMHDGNLVRVPQSQIEDKLPYYLKIKKHLSEAGVVDMEVGLYTTTADIEN
ncbi:POTRA domain protein, FtsQ-type [Streptococcus ictaluri 707-05]|uniref:Cell division protein DivIB n=1 Tax=Streptococcus ictaluri 707-05 TaxID=764299 RepID=G5K5Q1_9STRE|nr:POTRA domain protein, FtsQ-type [Streptococcus ictaluri 707-05]